MSSIVTGILSSTIGLLWDKVRDSTALKLKDGDVTDAEIRKIVVRELNDIKSRIDGLSRATLLASHDFLQEGVNLLNISLDRSNSGQTSRETHDEQDKASSDIQSGVLNEALQLSHAMKKLKINSDRELEAAKKRFEEARKTATTAFRNEAFSIEDRIFAAKLRIVSEILEHLDSPETAITGCLSVLTNLHSLPAIQETFSVYLNRGVKSMLNKTQRAKSVKSIMLINYVLFEYVWKVCGKCSLEVSACMPTIDLPARNFHPIVNWLEISARKSIGRELTHPPNGQRLDELIPLRLTAVNSQGDVLIFSYAESHANIVIIMITRKVKRVELPEFRGQGDNAKVLSVDINDNVYIVRERTDKDDKVFMLTILDEKYNVKADHRLNFLECKCSSQLIGIAICKNNDIILIKNKDPHVYVCNKTGKLKYRFERESSRGVLLNIYQQNEIMMLTDDRTAVQIYTKEGNLKIALNVQKDHKVLGVVFHYVIRKIMVLTWVEETNSYSILCYPEAGEKLENVWSIGSRMKGESPPKIMSHLNGPIVVVRERSITYL